MTDPSDCLGTWLQAGCGRIPWRAALEWTRLDLQADATALAHASPGQRWRLDSVGPGAGALATAFHAAMASAAPALSDRGLGDRGLGELAVGELTAIPVDEHTYLAAWRARAGRSLEAYAQPINAALLARSFAPQTSMLDALPFAAALVDAELCVTSYNVRAGALFETGQSIWLHHGRLALAQTGDAQSLHACVTRALMDACCGRPHLTRIGYGRARYPVAALHAPEPGACLILIVDREEQMRALWRGITDLDASELHLASAILAGPEAARTLF
ncbi:MAG: hypothetical protein M0D54_13665 [Hyphomonadaceae bacterium JAD_PAG50586_4]|nr:MAG: hypothetical protein M0D54_13665 [Hyphomonadaceae bacterium JAD_PAG50586_4]